MKRNGIRVLVAFFALAAASLTAESQIKLRYGAVNPESHPLLKGVKEFSRIVSEKSNGRIVIQVYAGGQLGDQKQNIQNLQMGALDMTMTQPGYLVDYGAKKMSVLGLPYLFRDDAHINSVLNGPIGNEFIDEVQKSGSRLVGLGFYPDGFRHYFFAKKSVSNLNELRNLKIRVQPGKIYVDVANALGFSPVPMAFSELYGAIQMGVVDGADQPISGYYANKYNEIAKNFTLDGHEAALSMTVFSEISWKRLSASDKKLIKDAFNESTQFYNRLRAESEVKATSELKAAGVQFSSPTDKAEWIKAMDPVYKKYGTNYLDLIQKIQETK